MVGRLPFAEYSHWSGGSSLKSLPRLRFSRLFAGDLLLNPGISRVPEIYWVPRAATKCKMQQSWVGKGDSALPTRAPDKRFDQVCTTADPERQRPPQGARFGWRRKAFRKASRNPGKLDAAADRSTGIPADIRVGEVNDFGRRAPGKGCRLPYRRNENGRERNFRVHFLQTASDNYLILFIYLPHPSFDRLYFSQTQLQWLPISCR